MDVNSMEDETMGMKEMKSCRCLELEERVLKAEEKYIELETEMKKGKNEFESLEFRFKELESEKLVVEEELRNLKESEESSLIDQMMVNKALEVEKQVAEKETEEWKRKFEKLVETVQKLDEICGFRFGEFELDENVKLGLELASINLIKIESCKVNTSSGSPCITTPVKDYIFGRRSSDNMSSRRRVNKMLSFEDDSTDVVDLCDSDTEKESDDVKETIEKRSVGESYEDEVSSKDKEAIEEKSNGENYEDDDVEDCEVNTRIRKRKRVINSDSENDDDDDNIPISILKKLKPPKKDMPEENSSERSRTKRRVSSRLRKQRVSEEMSPSSEPNPTERLVGIPTTGNVEGDDDETEGELDSETESMDGFIVGDDDDDEDDDDESVSEKSDDIMEEEEEADGETSGYAEVMSRLRRDKKIKKMKWEYEADMLADFGKDTELCMRAVCVLYRFQLEDEKLSRSSHYSNGRGFSKFDAPRGTRIGNFLTDGDAEGDLKKSVEELESFEPEAVETCRYLADRYSKQLFKIYNNREDPFFTLPPSP